MFRVLLCHHLGLHSCTLQSSNSSLISSVLKLWQVRRCMSVEMDILNEKYKILIYKKYKNYKIIIKSFTHYNTFGLKITCI